MTPKALIASLRFKMQHSAKKVAKKFEGLSGGCESNELAGFGCLALVQVEWQLVRNYRQDLQPRNVLLNRHITQSMGGISQSVLLEYFKIHLKNCGMELQVSVVPYRSRVIAVFGKRRTL